MELLLLRCRPGAQFRLGSHSLDRTDKILHSDTLFSGLANVWALCGEDVEELRSWFDHENESRVRMSSGLYALEHYKGETLANTIYFVPKPQVNLDLNGSKSFKEWKKIKYVSLAVLRELAELRRDGDGVFYCTNNVLRHVRIGNSCLCTVNELQSQHVKQSGNCVLQLAGFVTDSTAPKVHVHKLDDKDAYYSETNLVFRDVKLGGKNDANEYLRGHFYVLLDHSLSSQDYQRLLSCFRVLADEGIGGERSSGKGRLEEIEPKGIPQEFVNQDTDSQLHLLLSMLSPHSADEFEDVLVYDLAVRGAWFNRDGDSVVRHRKQVRLIKEGALLRQALKGRVVTVRDKKEQPHPIYRNGTAFSIPI